MKAGEKYIFCKSGRVVELISHADPYLKQKMWLVKRVDTGKEMIVPEKALIPIKESCVNCGVELNEAIDSDPNGAKNAVCSKCKAEEAHDFDLEPNVVFDRHGRMEVKS
jgi:hypothetical protein